MLPCPACGHENTADTEFCIRCGTSLGLVCANCATYNTAASRFCKRCGNAFATVAVPVAAGVAASPPMASAAGSATQRKACARCGSLNDVTDKFCYHCGWSLDNAQVSDLSQGVPGGFWIRFLAAIIDGVILSIPNNVITRFLPGIPVVDPINPDLGEFFLYAAITGGAGLLVNAIYAVVMVGAVGGTAGKLILGMRVVKVNGARVGYGRALGRFLASLISIVCLGLGYLWIAWDKDKRGWHDHIAGTKVIRKA